MLFITTRTTSLAPSIGFIFFIFYCGGEIVVLNKTIYSLNCANDIPSICLQLFFIVICRIIKRGNKTWQNNVENVEGVVMLRSKTRIFVAAANPSKDTTCFHSCKMTSRQLERKSADAGAHLVKKHKVLFKSALGFWVFILAK